MDQVTEKVVRLCRPCAGAAYQENMSHVTCGLHQQNLGGISTDYACPHLGRHFVVDAYVKYLDVIVMSSITSELAMAVLRQLLGQHGVSKMIVSNNGAQFTSLELGQFCKVNVIKHFSLPHHPSTNGQAVCFIDTFNCSPLELKCEGDVGHIVDEFLLTYSMMLS